MSNTSRITESMESTGSKGHAVGSSSHSQKEEESASEAEEQDFSEVSCFQPRQQHGFPRSSARASSSLMSRSSQLDQMGSDDANFLSLTQITEEIDEDSPGGVVSSFLSQYLGPEKSFDLLFTPLTPHIVDGIGKRFSGNQTVWKRSTQPPPLNSRYTSASGALLESSTVHSQRIFSIMYSGLISTMECLARGQGARAQEDLLLLVKLCADGITRAGGARIAMIKGQKVVDSLFEEHEPLIRSGMEERIRQVEGEQEQRGGSLLEERDRQMKPRSGWFKPKSQREEDAERSSLKQYQRTKAFFQQRPRKTNTPVFSWQRRQGRR